MPLEDDFSSQESDHESGDEDNADPNDSPMMSIFASYYGIEDSEADNKPKGTIDDVNFESDSYVKKLLVNETVEGLIAKDTEMVHEIRTLDGEMQKLVYDNYNKFITATETIKEMKNDVHGMDHDMDEVKLKMDAIAKSSGALDEVLQDKRSQVDKLVRVRRLLLRLEFLSELPERLAEMIDNKQYKEAVQLYNKTITVLTRHQHVLSFKNIKERTELMMKDLTGKVILMLDDITLEDVKLTQYVTVLRLMKAPRMKVMEKLLHAHKHRSMRMITQFNQLKAATTAATVTAATVTDNGGSASSLVKEMLTELTNARKFAQFLVVGLIEACKGVYDLFQVNYLEGTSEEQHLKEARQAHSELQVMIQSVMNEYTKSMGGAFKGFFERFNGHFVSQKVEYGQGEQPTGGGTERGSTSGGQRDSSATADSDPASEQPAGEGAAAGDAAATSAAALSDEKLAAEFKSSELQDERNKWLSLARQSINDVIYLDSTQSECFNNCRYEGEGAGSNVTYAQTYSEALLLSISLHGDVVQAHRVTCYLNSVSSAMPTLQTLCQIKSNAATSHSSSATSSEVSRPRLGGRTASSSSMALSDPAADRATLTRNTATARKLMDALVFHAVGSFSEAARDFKCTVEIYEVSQRDTEEAVVALVNKHVERLAHGAEALCGVVNHKYLFDPVAVKSTAHRSSQGGDSSEEMASDDIDLIYSEGPAGAAAVNTSNEFKSVFPSFSSPDTTSEVSVKSCLSLLFAGVFRKLLPVFWEEINNSLVDLELPTLMYRHELKTSCIERLTVTCELLLQSFVESNSSSCSSQLTRSQYEVFTDFYGQSSSSAGADHFSKSSSPSLITDNVLLVCKFLDLYALLCCIVLNEAPPPLKVHGMDRDLMRRGGGAAARASVVAGGHHNLQLDIERLFTQRIKVFDRLPTTATLDQLVGAVIKASLKATLESIRCMALPTAAYIQIQANATFMKQITSCLVKEATDCENLVEQILSAIFSRYLDANEIASVSDGNELQLISKGVSEAFTKLHDRAVLVIRATS